MPTLDPSVPDNPPRYFLLYSRAYILVGQYSGEDYMGRANAHMERDPDACLLAEVEGVAYVAAKTDKGIAVPSGRPQVLTCCCCGSEAHGRPWHNRDAGYGLCSGCIEYCMRGETVESFQRNYGLRGIHYDILQA